MKTPAPKHRAIIHLAADMRKGAGAHSVARKPGPSVEEWDYDVSAHLDALDDDNHAKESAERHSS